MEGAVSVADLFLCVGDEVEADPFQMFRGEFANVEAEGCHAGQAHIGVAGKKGIASQSALYVLVALVSRLGIASVVRFTFRLRSLLYFFFPLSDLRLWLLFYYFLLLELHAFDVFSYVVANEISEKGGALIGANLLEKR